MKITSLKKSSGFTLMETVLGVIIFMLALQILGVIASNYIHQFRMKQFATKLTSIPIAVQRRAAHDGFIFGLWANNGGQAELPSPITWDENQMDNLLYSYLVGRQNPSCGVATGWNPLNTDGTIDGGEETLMERAALISCNEFRGELPYNIKLSASLATNTNDDVGTFSLYFDMSEADFGEKNNPDNNIVNYTQFQQELRQKMSDSQNGVPLVQFGLRNELNDNDDDEIFPTTECSDRMSAGQPCDIILSIDFSGTTNGPMKRTDNQNSFVDDVTFKTSTAVSEKQKCAYWDLNGAGIWSQSIVDCAIKAGSGDDDVKLVFDASQANEFILTNEANLSHVCRLYTVDTDGALEAQPAPSSPCGLIPDGTGVVQLLTNNIHADDIFGKRFVAEEVFAGKMTLHSNLVGDIVIEAHNATHNLMTFSLSNNGDVFADGTMMVNGDATFNSNAIVNGDFVAVNNVNIELNNDSILKIGNPDLGNGIEMTDDIDFTIMHKGVRFEILTGNQEEGIVFDNAGGSTEMRLKAGRGVVADNGTHLHGSVSSLTNEVFSASNAQTDLEKLRSRLVTSDMAKFLDDTSSPIQIVGIDRVEGQFTTLNKPNCLAFMDDSNYSSPESNPYRQLIDEAGGIDPSSGRDYARLVLLPMYFKTFNSAFGDNQMFAQHASHSTPSTWDIYLYLSGEGAFSTGAREDGAGGSLAMTLCDYSALNFSRQQF